MVGNGYVNLLWKLTLMINGRANKSFSNNTINCDASAKTEWNQEVYKAGIEMIVKVDQNQIRYWT